MRLSPSLSLAMGGVLACFAGTSPVAWAGQGASACPCVVPLRTGESTLTCARCLEVAGDRAAALQVLQTGLSAFPGDDDLRGQLARVLAREGRWFEAEGLLREVVARHPEDDDVRGVLADVLLWSRQWGAAEAQVALGLAIKPDSPALLLRQARLSAWRGDVGDAIGVLDRAARIAPADESLVALRDSLFLGEARVLVRNDIYPQGWPDQPSAELSVLQRVGRAALTGRTEQALRPSAAVEGGKVYNAYYAGGASFTPAVGWNLGAEFGGSAPATALPTWTARLAGAMPLPRGHGLSLAGSWWAFNNGNRVWMVNPGIRLVLSDRVRLDVRYWRAWVVPPGADGSAGTGSVQAVNTLALQGTFRVHPRFACGLSYAYGVQLDRVPNGYQLTSFASNIVGSFLDWAVVPGAGLRPAGRVELRSNDNGQRLTILGAELAAWVRW